jgi:hypothetical protein
VISIIRPWAWSVVLWSYQPRSFADVGIPKLALMMIVSVVVSWALGNPYREIIVLLRRPPIDRIGRGAAYCVIIVI